MNVPHQRNLRRPSISSRLSFAISTHSAETGVAPEDVRPAQEHIEEIEEIRRYEVGSCDSFTGKREVDFFIG
jgi:hypothetical protein